MYRALLTSGGFLSSHIVSSLEKDPRVDEIVVWTDPDKYKGLPRGPNTFYAYDADFPGTNYDVVFHTFGCPKAYAEPTEIIYSNVDFLSETLLPEMGKQKNPRFINISSIVVENKPLSVYGASKLMGESLVEYYTGKNLIRGVSVRPCAIVGKGSKGLLKDIVDKLKSDSPTLKLLTNSCKPFIYVNKLAEILIDIAFSDLEGVYSVSSPDALTVEEVANIVMDILKIDKPIEWGQSWVGDQNYITPHTDFHTNSATLAIVLALMQMEAS